MLEQHIHYVPHVLFIAKLLHDFGRIWNYVFQILAEFPEEHESRGRLDIIAAQDRFQSQMCYFSRYFLAQSGREMAILRERIELPAQHLVHIGLR